MPGRKDDRVSKPDHGEPVTPDRTSELIPIKSNKSEGAALNETWYAAEVSGTGFM